MPSFKLTQKPVKRALIVIKKKKKKVIFVLQLVINVSAVTLKGSGIEVKKKKIFRNVVKSLLSACLFAKLMYLDSNWIAAVLQVQLFPHPLNPAFLTWWGVKLVTAVIFYFQLWLMFCLIRAVSPNCRPAVTNEDALPLLYLPLLHFPHLFSLPLLSQTQSSAVN